MGVPQIIHFNRSFQLLGHPPLWKPPYTYVCIYIYTAEQNGWFDSFYVTCDSNQSISWWHFLAEFHPGEAPASIQFPDHPLIGQAFLHLAKGTIMHTLWWTRLIHVPKIHGKESPETPPFTLKSVKIHGFRFLWHPSIPKTHGDCGLFQDKDRPLFHVAAEFMFHEEIWPPYQEALARWQCARPSFQSGNGDL